MSVADKMVKVVDGALSNQIKMRKAMETLGVETRVLRSVAPMDDGIPPSKPTGLVAEEFIMTIALTWDSPDTLEAVEKVVVDVSGGNQHLTMDATSMRGHTLVNMPNSPHDVKIKFVDYYGRESEWSDTVAVTPKPSVSVQISDFEQDILTLINDELSTNLFTGINGKIPESKFETIEEAATFGNGVILARTMAAGNAAFMDAWIETAAIRNAMIESITADKIETSTLSASTSISCAGVIQATGGGIIKGGGGSITPDGFTMTSVSSGVSWPAQGKSDWFTPAGGAGSDPFPYAGFTFFNSPAEATGRPANRGMLLAASGVNGIGRTGRFRVQVSDGSNDISKSNSAYIDVLAKTPADDSVVSQIMLGGSTRIEGPFYPRASGTITLGANSQAEFNANNGGSLCKLFNTMVLSAGRWYPFVHQNNGFEVSIENNSSGRTYVTNTNAVAYTIMANFYG